MTDLSLPLKGIRVLELGHIVAGPAAGMILADLGADVVKIEPPNGDRARRAPDSGASFYSANRNKRSLAIDLKRPAGVKVFLRLVDTADVVIDNHSPSALDRLGVGSSVVLARNPRVVFCQIRGFLRGLYGQRLLLDELAQMMGGLAYMTGPSGKPMRAGASVIDIGAGMFAVIAILGALLARSKTGTGQRLEVGLFEMAAFWIMNALAATGITGSAPLPMPMRGMGARLGFGIYRLFRTRDHRDVFIAVTSDAQWERFCAEFGLEDLWSDQSLRTDAGRIAQHETLNTRVAEVIARLDAMDLMTRLDRRGVPFAPVNTPADVLEDPHMNGRGGLLDVPIEGQRHLRLPSLPVSMEGATWAVRLPPPRLGQDSVSILEATGYSDAEVKQLLAEGVVRVTDSMLFEAEPRK